MTRTQFLVGTVAHNLHVQHMVRALAEVNALDAFMTGGVYAPKSALGRWCQDALARRAPAVDRALANRAVGQIAPDRIRAHWGWEVLRLAANRIGATEVEDRFWERSELGLDERCARVLRDGAATGFLGVEHGALRALETARAMQKVAVVAFLSPHAATRAKWVDDEWRRWPELQRPGQRAIEIKSADRDARRHREAEVADWIVTNSSFTTRSLVDAGLPAAKMVTVPLGGPAPIALARLPGRPADRLRVMYAGPVSVRKGAHYLLRAWREVTSSTAELHLYGSVLLPNALLDEAKGAQNGDRIVVHGSVSSSRLTEAYQQSSVMILPTLCDGFGMVILEALANGLPVITTSNAGGADAVVSGRSGFVIPPADTAAIVERLTWCETNSDALFTMRRSALDRAADWTWDGFRERFRSGLEMAGVPIRAAA